MTTLQANTGRTLVRAGAILQLTGLLWGLVLEGTPYPRLGLTAHIQCMQSGNLFIVYGLVLRQPGLVHLKHGLLQARVIEWGLLAIFVTVASEMFNAFWGTNNMLPLAAKAAGAVGGLPWQEKVVTLAHFLPAFTLISGIFSVLVGLFGQADGTQKVD